MGGFLVPSQLGFAESRLHATGRDTKCLQRIQRRSQRMVQNRTNDAADYILNSSQEKTGYLNGEKKNRIIIIEYEWHVSGIIGKHV